MATKSKLKISLLACAMIWGGGEALAYDEKGTLGNTLSWESPEYLNQWGLKSLNVSTAYALGITGKGVKIGVLDSGILLSHPEFLGGRFLVVKQQGKYGKNGLKYPDANVGNAPFNKNQPIIFDINENKYIANHVETDFGEFKKGESFSLDGNWIYGVNDAHGVNVAGVIGANRDGNQMHGVAFEATIYSANTGGNDNMTYGPTQDYEFFLNAYTALAKEGVKFINNSWGSNRRLNSAYTGATGWVGFWDENSNYDYTIKKTNAPSAHMDLKDLESAKKAYYQFVLTKQKSFLDAAYEVAKNNNIVQIFTAGNRTSMQYPFTRAMLAYFRPDIENLWLNVTGEDGDSSYPDSSYVSDYAPFGGQGAHIWNESRGAKWWSIAAPALNTKAPEVLYEDLSDASLYGSAGYTDLFGGTSGAAPHIAGVLGLIAQRYPYMSPALVREILLTTARQTKFDDSTQMLDGWTAQANTPDNIWGWGVADVSKAIFGPAQFLGTFNLNLDTDDTFSNDISDVAIKFRKTEDEAEQTAWLTRKSELDKKANLSDEEKAEYEVELARQTARDLRAKDGYEGKLIKNGKGTLTLTGNNTFSGDTTINNGKIKALNQSLQNSKVIVNNGASLEILNEAIITKPSQTGFVSQTIKSTANDITATINGGGTFIANNGVSGLNLNFLNGSKITQADTTNTKLKSLYQNPSDTLTYAISGNFTGYAEPFSKYALFSLTQQNITTNITLSLQKSRNFSDLAENENQKNVANTIQNAPNSKIFTNLMSANEQKFNEIYNALTDTKPLKAQNHAIINGILLSSNILNQANFTKIGVDENLWILSSSNFNTISDKNLKTKQINQLISVKTTLGENANFGVFIGKGRSDDKNLKNNDTHAGIYANADFNTLWLDSTVSRTHKNAKINTPKISDDLNVAYERESAKFNLTQAFLRAGINYNQIKPYISTGYLKLKDRELKIATAGVLGTLSFDNFSLKGDLGFSKFFGDKTAFYYVGVGDAGDALIKGDEIKNLITANFGIEKELFKNAKFSLFYQGAYNKNAKSNGISANFSLAF
ncbi:S8 family serine peptidase [Campylobacter gastrosuis]|uniref:S8 family serine peptidase n=1 Tax=Campylobacter gastrosuis TaxID=2974576 RepID=A0ABT7HQ41_9BACT|nr:S8 family serine peptidase [Campylobacter gastrosuis]MDL0089036.1 S8 family serine peptidase [Campylobacter gastrosuis]